MEEVAVIGILEEVALKLHTEVTTVGALLACAIREACELADVLRIAHEALCDRVHGVFKSEGALELSGLDAEEFVLLPLSEEIDETDVGLRLVGIVGVTVDLHLHFPVEVVVGAAFKSHSHESEVEAVVLGIFLVAGLILHHAVAAELDVLKPFALGRGRERRAHHEGCDKSLFHLFFIYILIMCRLVFCLLMAPVCYLLTRSTTFSTWGVWGNISTGCTATTRYWASRSCRSRAWVAGLQLT